MVSERPFAAAQPAVTHTNARALTRCVLNRQSEKHAITGRKTATQAIFFHSFFFVYPKNKQINKQTDKQMAHDVEPWLIMKTERWDARTFAFFRLSHYAN